MGNHNLKELKIEKGIPLPPQSGFGYRATFRLMEIGDSIFFECADHEKMRATLTGTISQLKREKKFKFASRRVNGGLRVWRTE